jgi:VCBS repeat-containing protein
LTYNPRTSTLLNGLREGETITELFIYLPADTMGVAATTATVTITVSGRNDAPTAVGEPYSTSEDSLLNVPAAGLLANDSDVDQDTLQVAAFTGTSTLGVPVTVNANGSFSYDPRNVAVLQRLSAGESATDTIPYTIQDGNGGTASAIATITVTGVNDLPVATQNTYSIDEDSTLIVSGAGVLENDRDPDTNNVLEVIAAGATSNQDATVVFNPDGSRTYVFLTQLGAPVRLNSNGTFSFDPTMLSAFQNLAVGQTLVDRFVYTTGDGAVPVGSAQAMVMITVEGRNDAPIVVNDLYTVAEDSQLVVAATNGVLSHPQTGDRDPEGSPISASLVTGPRHGQLSFTTAGGFTYTPNANFSGDDTFTYVARDGVAVSQPATVTIRVTGINDAPQAAADTLTVDQNSSLTLAAPGILSNDTDVDGETLSAVRVSGTGPSSGTLVLNASGALNYTPNPGFFGTDSFQYDAVDGGGLRSRATVTINVRNIHAWQNPTNRLDVTADGVVTSRDALLIINWLNANGSGPVTPGVAGPPYRDVNGDDQVTPVGDVLPVINFLNNLAAGEAEGTVRVAVSGAGSDAGEGEGLGSSSLLSLGLADLDAPLPGQNPFPPRPLPQPGTAARQVLSSRHDQLWSSLPSASANAEAHLPANSSSPIDAALEDTDLDALLDTIASEIDSTWSTP